MVHYVTVATCALNQWALDFQGNYERIRESILQAKAGGARLRIGPELEIPGYGCQDHFLESDTTLHSWEVLARLLQDRSLDGVLIDTGMPVLHRNSRYNCRVVILDGRILLIRPKMHLANDGNYREPRWFTEWARVASTEDYVLPRFIADITGQKTVPFGDALISTEDSCVGIELCEELFTPQSPHIAMSLDGAEIIVNSSGSHHELRKLGRRIELIREATLKCGGVYLYANQKGCDGDRVYYDGSAMVLANGEILAMGTQFSISDVEVTLATVDLGAVRAFRAGMSSRSTQAARSSVRYPRVVAGISLSAQQAQFDFSVRPTRPLAPRLHAPAEEIALGPACWLWDYVRRSSLGGFFLPLSGGIDSCATAVVVHSMCRLVVDACGRGDAQALADVGRVCGESGFVPATAQELASRIFCTSFMGTANSTAETRARARALAAAIGSYHIDVDMDAVVAAIVGLFALVTGRTPRYAVHGGTSAENLALQNIQARLRMLLAYLLAALVPWVRRAAGRPLLVLASANVDEALRGYFTKYDCSSADLNPIGSISKADLRGFIAFARDSMGLDVLGGFLDAVPSAELVPFSEDYKQSDEDEMGMSYDELGVYGRLRKIKKCGPYSMFAQLLHEWPGVGPREIADKVKRFFFYYAVNRHKMTTLTPAYHAEAYSPDDNRFDLRQFLYNAQWTWQFGKIDDAVERLARRSGVVIEE
ncbi:glutamine-dependent NAD(+) synthetase [Coemansia sp. IMI 209128]|nr:glutamine-dependent NAD(+) synthetase [Coemansia sp. IMI 209128]